MYRNQSRERAAIAAADFVRRQVHLNWAAGPSTTPRVGVILGTGWGDAFGSGVFTENQISLVKIPGFEKLNELEAIEGHERILSACPLGRAIVFVMQGRIHMNEAPCDPEVPKLVRLQTELLLQLGVNLLIVTSASGSLGTIEVGEVGVIQSLLTTYAPEMPLWGGEFVSPEDALNHQFVSDARGVADETEGISARFVTYAMVRGPQFESHKDKLALRALGADVVGMSTVPECAVAGLYEVPVIALTFVTNAMEGRHDHRKNVARAKESGPQLGVYLRNIIEGV